MDFILYTRQTSPPHKQWCWANARMNERTCSVCTPVGCLISVPLPHFFYLYHLFFVSDWLFNLPSPFVMFAFLFVSRCWKLITRPCTWTARTLVPSFTAAVLFSCWTPTGLSFLAWLYVVYHIFLAHCGINLGQAKMTVYYSTSISCSSASHCVP